MGGIECPAACLMGCNGQDAVCLGIEELGSRRVAVGLAAFTEVILLMPCLLTGRRNLLNLNRSAGVGHRGKAGAQLYDLAGILLISLVDVHAASVD